ncbi:DOMON domain-containing protein [Sediminicola luteus]|uniref:DOMON domain-containing protein n=1 Tax=Sediminicola luteus TaxID=319238 RepID=A0A2A4GF75_9FLAO|nr:DOMON domain-containing protein [Sediminicola luteus]PCE66630.1 hypothetical protein B7P33_04870 [Sediminicola luteus]
MKTILLMCLSFPLLYAQPKSVQVKNMTVHWSHETERVNFVIQAPTQGWVAIGFNEKPGLSGTYLLMGRINGHKVEIVEHFTLRPGDYRPLTTFGAPISVSETAGHENEKLSTVRFSLPHQPKSPYQKNLKPGKSYHLLLAYSQEDDFKHHSIMRTSIQITL